MRGIKGLNNTPHRITKKYAEGHIDLSTAFFLMESAHWTRRTETKASPIFDFLRSIIDVAVPRNMNNHVLTINPEVSRELRYQRCEIVSEWKLEPRTSVYWFTSLGGLRSAHDPTVMIPIVKVKLFREQWGGGNLFTARVNDIADAEKAYRDSIFQYQDIREYETSSMMTAL